MHLQGALSVRRVEQQPSVLRLGALGILTEDHRLRNGGVENEAVGAVGAEHEACFLRLLLGHIELDVANAAFLPRPLLALALHGVQLCAPSPFHVFVFFAGLRGWMVSVRMVCWCAVTYELRWTTADLPGDPPLRLSQDHHRRLLHQTHRLPPCRQERQKLARASSSGQ
jgi:hypothetical protein